MTRFLCFSLLVLIIFPVFAQEEQMSFPRGNQDVLMRMHQQLTQELQQVQRMLNVIPPTDTQYIEIMKAQQTELTKQLKDIAQQLQESEITNALPGRETRIPEMPGISRPPESMLAPGMGLPPSMPGMMPQGGYGQSPLPTQPQVRPYPDLLSPVVPPQIISPYNSAPVTPPYMPQGMPDQAWDNPWGPRPAANAKELTEMKQSVDSLRREIADLKETVKTLEAQIQLLNRNIVLERAKGQ